MNNWEEFWQERKNKEVEQRPFVNNFEVLLERLKQHFGLRLAGLRSLEVGCGRATMSDKLHGILFDTYCIDKHYKPPENGRKHKFYQADAFGVLPFPTEYFDLVFSYGLLEHFPVHEQMELLRNMKSRVKMGGLSIHYVVPKKLTNYFEDRNVDRLPCYWLQSQNVTWVYPIIGKKWKTNKWLGKGFWYEDTSVSNG